MMRGGAGAVAALLVLLALAVGAAVFEVLVPAATKAPEGAPVVGQGPVSAGVWYCPATARADETALLTVAAVGREPSTVEITRFRDGEAVADPPATVRQGEALELALRAGAAAEPIAVRWRGGPAVAHWRVDGVGDNAAAPCESGPATTWHLTGFDTSRGSRSTVHLFNPFGVDAVARLRFATAEGRVDLVIADNQLIEAGTSTAIDLSEFRPEVSDLGVTVEVLSGRLVAQGQLLLGGGAGGRALIRAAARPALQWEAAQMRSDAASKAWLSIQNPSDREAALEIQVSDPSDEQADLLGETSVPAGGVVRIDLSKSSSQPEFGVAVVSVNETPVVVSAFWTLRNAQGRGLAATLASPGPATEWALAGGGTEARSGLVSIYNPGTADATVTVLSPRGRLPQWSGLRLTPNQRITVDLGVAGANLSAVPVRVVSDLPVVAELRSLSVLAAPRLWANLGVPAVEWAGTPTRPLVRRDPSLETLPAETPTAEPELSPVDLELPDPETSESEGDAPDREDAPKAGDGDDAPAAD